MFFDELQPIFKELTSEPIAFMGGFVSGVLRLDLSDDPIKSWLGDEAPSTAGSPPNSDNGSSNGSSDGPQSITIE